MPSRTTIPGTTDPGDIWTSANVDDLPGGRSGYAPVTASQTGITAEADLTNLSVTVDVPADRLIKVSCLVHIDHVGGANFVALLSIKEGTTYLGGAVWEMGADATGAEQSTFSPFVLLTPSAASHTYKLSLALSAGTGTLSSVASATRPAYILVEDIGPSS